MHQDYQKHKMLYFIGTFAIIFLVSFIIFSFSGLAPAGLRFSDYVDIDVTKTFLDRSGYYETQLNEFESYTRPDHITIDKIGVDININKPNTTVVEELDRSLLTGAVHYPGSGSVESGNMYIFGHSSSLQVVNNPAYAAFSGLRDLVPGDVINIEADGQTYLYKVTSVNLVNENTALVEFNKGERMLTLSTCNTFGRKEERYVVEAEFWQ